MPIMTSRRCVTSGARCVPSANRPLFWFRRPNSDSSVSLKLNILYYIEVVNRYALLTVAYVGRLISDILRQGFKMMFKSLGATSVQKVLDEFVLCPS